MPDLTGLPPEAARYVESQQQQPMAIGAGMVGVSALTVQQRRELLTKIDVQDALSRLADIQTRWDVASSTDWNVAGLQLDLLLPTSTEWTSAVRAEVNKGNVFTTPPATLQLMRELMETDPASGREMTAEELVLLLLSINSEQQQTAEFDSETPTVSDFAALDAKFQKMAPDDLYDLAREFLTKQNAGMLFNAVKKIEVLKADIWDLWYSPWSDRASDDLGDRPADTFKMATGIEFDDYLRAGIVVAQAIRARRNRIALDDVSDDPRVRDFITTHMSLNLASYRVQLADDRARGDIKLQRFGFTRYPFLDLEDGTLLILRAQWALERFFGDPPQFDVVAAFVDAGDKQSANRFTDGIKHQFEGVVGRIVARIAAGSSRVSAVVDEAELQKEWTKNRGKTPSVCDWVLRAGPVNVLVEATHHPVKESLAQGLAGGEVYDEDANRVLTNRKFKQLASVMDLIRGQGWSGQPQVEAIFIPIVVVPNSGTPSSSLSEMDNAKRAEAVFAPYQGRVARPAIMQLRDLQLLEGIGDHLPGDVVSCLYEWRKFPLPLSLQEFLELKNAPRPVSKYIFDAARRLDEHLRRAGAA
ncbi:hypothetical protein FOV72_20920 [Gordonia rubripertincta]|uniref:hypothetical protein n=1 Tax=Gordonia rubripertincta TaxID=36822 RepID=UPI00117D9078|nr:hypothetical protein [Gordonia rubripertincta]TSD93112.1 hypothetical protein FOV72_20920 [Gordonia rubripertincta]